MSKDQVKKWLATQRTYTIHKPIRKKFTRNKVTSFKIDYLWQIDLIDMIKLGKFNDGIEYFLTCIDVFSKYAWVVPLKDKSASETVRAFKEILKTGRKPKHVQSDKGKEFLNKQIKKVFDENSMKIYTYNNSEIKAPVIERFNRTLKEKMFKYFTAFKTYTYVDNLSKFVDTYNKSYHRSIKMYWRIYIFYKT